MVFRHDSRNWMRYSGVGLEFTLTFLGGLALGYWLDQVHGPLPTYLLTCGAIGFGVGLYRLIRQALEIRREDNYSDGRQQGRDNVPGDSDDD